MMTILKKLAIYILRSYPKGLLSIVVKQDVIIINVEKDEILNYCTYLKTDGALKCEMLLDIWGVDYPERNNRFEINYLLVSARFNMRIIIKTSVSENMFVESLTSLYKSSGWLEREVWDMYGIYFINHNDLRRILTDYGFKGHPLRKDFPLTGYVEVRYADGQKRVVVEPIEMVQEYRTFDFESPWRISTK